MGSRGKTLIVRGASGSGKVHYGCQGSFPLLKCSQLPFPTYKISGLREVVYIIYGKWLYNKRGAIISVDEKYSSSQRWLFGEQILLIFPSDKQRAQHLRFTSQNYNKMQNKHWKNCGSNPSLGLYQ